jgi:hypothetical protein
MLRGVLTSIRGHICLIRSGFATDLVLFDPATVTDRSTYDAGRTPAEGVAHVLVNGTLVLETARRPAPPPATPCVGADPSALARSRVDLFATCDRLGERTDIRPFLMML